MKQHSYNTFLRWTGNKGEGTQSYSAYERSHIITIDGKPDLLCSSDPHFRGDITKHNPEELFVASLSSCHMLWYLHLCAVAGIVVVDYSDEATATMVEHDDGSGRFTEVVLHPKVIITNEAMIATANELHHKANRMCFIANSCNFPVRHSAKTLTATI